MRSAWQPPVSALCLGSILSAPALVQQTNAHCEVHIDFGSCMPCHTESRLVVCCATSCHASLCYVVALQMAFLSLLSLVQSLVVWLGLAAGLVFCVWGSSRGRVSVGDTVLFISMMQQLYVPLTFFGSYYRQVRPLRASWQPGQHMKRQHMCLCGCKQLACKTAGSCNACLAVCKRGPSSSRQSQTQLDDDDACNRSTGSSSTCHVSHTAVNACRSRRP
jgi:ABC-type multidrug transport system fused ATPase/permease subunit